MVWGNEENVRQIYLTKRGEETDKENADYFIKQELDDHGQIVRSVAMKLKKDEHKECCEGCMIYRVQHNELFVNPFFKCCGHYLKYEQNIYGTIGHKCPFCGNLIAIDMNMPCEGHGIFKFRIPPGNMDRDHLKILARYLECNVVEIYKLMKTEGILIDDYWGNMGEVISFLEENNISYFIEPFDPREKYTYWKECRYPYKIVRQTHDCERMQGKEKIWVD